MTRGEDYPVSLVPGLYTAERGDRVLVVSPATASWAVIPREQAAVLELLRERPLFFGELCDRVSALPEGELCGRLPTSAESELAQLLDRFYEHGIVNLNWKSFFPPEQVMWAPLDDPPIYPYDIYFHTTERCNFRCRYCYASATGRGRKMTLRLMKTIIDRVLDELPHRAFNLQFHGGEPLLSFREIAEFSEYASRRAESCGKRIFFAVQSNGALIDDKVIAWAKEHQVDFGVTLDGPPNIHDEARVYPDGRGTWEDVWTATQRALREGVGLGYICIVRRPEDYLRDYEFFVSRGIFSFNIRFSFAVGRAAEEYSFEDELPRRMASGALDMLDDAAGFVRRTGVPVRIHDLNMMLGALLSKRRDYICMRSPCGIGRSIISFGPGGDIFPCEEMSAYPVLAMGNIRDRRPLTEIIDQSPLLAKLRARRVESIVRCRECPWRRFCLGRCTHKTWHAFGGDHMREDPSCAFFAALFEELMWRLDENPALRALASP
jgi:radical SAM protein with 4Fe4S-binding SPASM domain